MIRKAAIISISGLILTQKEKTIIKKEKPWGIILFKRNILSENQLINLTKCIRKLMKDKRYPILIDEEGGKVSRLSDFLDFSQYSQEYFGETYKLNKNTLLIIKLVSLTIENGMKILGVNLPTKM